MRCLLYEEEGGQPACILSRAAFRLVIGMSLVATGLGVNIAKAASSSYQCVTPFDDQRIKTLELSDETPSSRNWSLLRCWSLMLARNKIMTASTKNLPWQFVQPARTLLSSRRQTAGDGYCHRQDLSEDTNS